MLVLSFTAFVTETLKIGSLQEPIFATGDIGTMRRLSESLYGANGTNLRLNSTVRTHSDLRVMVVLMDGLRFDHGECRGCGWCSPFPGRALTHALPLVRVWQWTTWLFGEMRSTVARVTVPATRACVFGKRMWQCSAQSASCQA